MTKLRILFAPAALMLGSSSAMAELSANAGFVSEYIFRGYYQAESSASAGFDFEQNGFYAGTWGADLNNGLEYDLYFGYGSGNDDFSWSVGYTAYRYTESSFDDDYDEINLGIGAGGFSLDVALGEYGAGLAGVNQDYTYIGIGYALENGTSFLIAQTDYDDISGSPGSGADGTWFEVSHAWEFADSAELSVTFLYSSDGDDPASTIWLGQDNPLATHALVFGISKGFSIGD